MIKLIVPGDPLTAPFVRWLKAFTGEPYPAEWCALCAVVWHGRMIKAPPATHHRQKARTQWLSWENAAMHQRRTNEDFNLLVEGVRHG